MISHESLRIVKETAPVVKDNAVAITSTFYPKMLGRHPELYDYFNETNQKKGVQGARSFGNFIPGELPTRTTNSNAGQQTKTLADAIVAYAMNIDKLENLDDLVNRMCHKHAALGVKPNHYQIVHDNLLEAIGEVLGDTVTPEVAAAWSEAVTELGKICISTEDALYKEADKQQWSGAREFFVSDAIEEAKDIVSLKMKPSDGFVTYPFEPGQYITVYEKPSDKKYFAPRHYTVTSKPTDDFYQITVKKAKSDGYKGAMSHLLHNKKAGDKVMLGPVFGPAPLRKFSSKDRTGVFISAGVGITSTVSMLERAMEICPDVMVFHADDSPQTMAFRGYLTGKAQNCPQMSLDISYSRKASEELPFDSDGMLYVTEGILTVDKIVNKLVANEVSLKDGADFFVCAGPTNSPAIYKGLAVAGVEPNRIHVEYFSPFVTLELEDN